MRGVLLLVFAFSLLSSLCYCATKDYVKISNCKAKRICSYEYNVDAQIKGGERVDVSANVDIFCESVGVFMREPSVRHCITVRDAVARTVNERNKYDANHIVPIKKLNKWFCFAQSTSSGKVLGVFHPKGEKNWIVNFKKSIASAFQANYKGTTVTNETDSQSRHTSHYKYYSEGNNWQIQERRIDTRDVSTFAGNKVFIAETDKSLYFHEHDKIELDNDKRIRFSEGKSILEQGPEKEEKVASTASMNDNDKGIPALGAVSDYKLKLVHCSNETNNDQMAKLSASLSSHKCRVDDLLASINEAEEDAETMMELNDELPPFDETARRLQEDFESQESIQLMANWRTLLELESKNGPLSDTKAKLPQLLQRLDEIKSDENSIGERVIIYHLLSSVDNLDSQQALLDMLKVPSLTASEATSLLVEIALLPAVHSSTVKSLLNQYELLDSNDYVANQLILSIATLGRHKNVEEKIVNYLSVKLTSAVTSEETSLLIHALGNTASKRIIPLLLLFLFDPSYQAHTIDALCTVSMDDRVEKEFASVVSQSMYPDVVFEVVQSLIFPFKHSIYSSRIKKDLAVCDELKTSLVEACVRYNEHELTKSVKQYFAVIEDEIYSEELGQRLEEEVPAHRVRRASTRNWASSSDSKYNLVGSLAQRHRDISTYPFNRGYLWTTKIGYSKLHANVAAGGFGGVGTEGIKLYARARVDLVAWSKRYTALDVIFSYVRGFADKNSKSTLNYRRYIRLAGRTLLNEQHMKSSVYRYTRSWHKSVPIFTTHLRFLIVVGTLRLTLSSYISGHLGFQAYIARLDNDKNMRASAELTTGPTLTITGEAVAKVLLIYKLGLRVSASISYRITPTASTSLCDTSPNKGDANACFEVYSTTSGKISVEAYYQRRRLRCRIRRWRPRCTLRWSSKRRFRPLSRTWNLFTNRKKLFGSCRVCECYGSSFFNIICKGSRSGVSTCSCSTRSS